jgi:phosphonate transport system permease protein
MKITDDALDPGHWSLRPWMRARTVALLLLALLIASYSGQRTEIDRMLVMSVQAVGAAAGSGQPSQVAEGFSRIGRNLLPIQLSETTELARIKQLDRNNLPWGTRIESQPVIENRLDPETLEMSELIRDHEVLVAPFGYLLHVLWLMVETIEIAAWGTVIALVLGAPLAVLGARGYSPHGSVYLAARGVASFLRSIPDLISALFLVLAFGFGPIAGVLALGLHTAGFLGKFFAEDIENAPKGPQDALRASGAGRLKVLRFAVLPQVMPSYLGYLQYILERNIRTATVIGIVGAGGIGQELKGRFEMFDFAHVGTMLLVIFLTVIALEAMTGKLRQRLL